MSGHARSSLVLRFYFLPSVIFAALRHLYLVPPPLPSPRSYLDRSRVLHTLSPLRSQLPALPLISFHIPALSCPCARGSTLSCFRVSPVSLSSSCIPTRILTSLLCARSTLSLPRGSCSPYALIPSGILASYLSFLFVWPRLVRVTVSRSFDPSTTLLS